MKFVRRMLLFTLAAVVLIVPVRAKDHEAIMPVPHGDYANWTKRHEAMTARVKEGNVDLVFIGDSITQGWELHKEVWQQYYGKRNAVNLGVGGDRTQHVIWRLENGNLEGISPKLAVIMIGSNNSATNTPEQIAEGTTAIVNQLRTKTPKTKILVLAVFPRGESPADPRRQVNEKTNAIVSKLADGEHVFYLDIGKNFLQDDGTMTREFTHDFVHLSKQSYTIWAESIEPIVAKLMGE